MSLPVRILYCCLMVLLVFTSLTSVAQVPEPPLIDSAEPRTIDDLVNIAIENQAEYKKALYDVDFSKYAIRGAWGAFLPRADATISYNNARNDVESYSFGGVIYPGSKEWSHSSSWDIRLYEDLFTGGSRFFRLKSSRLQLENTDLARIRTRDELVYYVKEAVYYYLSSKRSLELSKEILDLRKESHRYAKTRYENGDVIELDVIQAEIDVGNAENSVLTAKQNLENTRESINLVIGADLESRFPIDADLTPVLPESDVTELVNKALTWRSDFKILKNNEVIQDQNVKIANAAFLPTATLSAGISGSDEGMKANRFRAFPDDNSRYYGVGVSLDLFSQFQNSINRQQYVIAKRKATWDRHSSELQIDSDIRRQWRDLERLYDQILVLDKNRELARRQLELEQERYRLGASSQLNLRSAQVTFIEAENEHIYRVLEYFTTLASFERDLGRPLEEAIQ